MSSRDQIFQQNAQRKSRAVKLSSNEHARIMPTTFYHDNEQLYSEAIKLKQRTNATLDENVKLKTRIAVLEKEKSKLLLFIQDHAVKQRGHSRSGTQQADLNSSAVSRERDNRLANMQRLFSEAKETIEALKA